MDVEREFDDRLLKKGVRGAGRWIEEWCETYPWDQHARACRAFAHALQGRSDAMEETEAVLGMSPFNEWALAALYVLVWPKSVDEDSRFTGWDGFRLEPVWIAKLWVLGHPIKAYTLYLVILKYGDDEENKALSKDFGGIPDRMLEEVKKDKKSESEFERLCDQVILELEEEFYG